MLKFQLKDYLSANGHSPFNEWLTGLRDAQARALVRTRLDRVRLGNLGDHVSVGGGVFELRIFYGPGYRVYFSLESEKVATSRDYQESLINGLRDPKEAAAYLDAALEYGDRPAFLLAIRNVIDALGGMSKISRHTGLNRENLYRVLSEKGNPELNSLEKLLKALGLRLSVEVDQYEQSKS